MAEESRKIILQLEVDAGKAINEVIGIKDQIAKLKTEQKGLNVETLEGKKTFEAYNAQIKALTKEQRSLEGAIEKTAAGFQFEAGSIAANRAELSKLTAEYKNLAAPTKEQTDRIKNLSDTLKTQESAIGNNTRNVGNYGEALTGVTSQLGMLSPQIGQLTAGFSGVTKSLSTVAKGFTTLGGAVKASGIGLLLVLLGSLISYFKSSDEGAAKLEGAMGAIGAVVKSVTGIFTEFGSAIADVITGTTSMQSVFEGIGDFFAGQLFNRINAIKNLFGELATIITFQSDDVTKSLVKTGDSALDFLTGIEGTRGVVIEAAVAIKDWAKDIAAAAKISFEYAQELDKIEDAQRALNLTNAKASQEVAKLIIQAKNKSKTDEERIALLLEANKIEEGSVASQKKLDKDRLNLLIERNKQESNFINQKINRDIANEKSEEKKLELEKKRLSIQDKLSEEEIALRIKIVNAETSLLSLKETNQNKISVLEEKIAADRKKAYEDYLAQLEAINSAEVDLSTQRLARKIVDLQYEISLLTKQDSEKIKLLKTNGANSATILKAQAEERIELLKKLEQEEIRLVEKKAADEQLKLIQEGLKDEANQKEIALKRIAIEEKKKNDIIDIERKISDETVAINKKTNEDIAANTKKTNDELKQDVIKGLNTTGTLLNNFAQTAIQANQAALDRNLLDNEAARNRELKAYAGNKLQQDKINKKFDKIAADQKRKAAKTDLALKEIQAVANVALGISQAIAQGGVAGIITGLLVAAAGAIQIASIETQKSKLAKGGLINIGGNLHSNGGTTFRGTDGTVFEAERGEVLAVVNRHDAPKLSYLSGINSFHGTPFFAENRPSYHPNHFADGGLVARVNGGSIQQENSLSDSLKNIQIVVGVKDIISSVDKKVQVVDRSKVAR